MFERKVFYMGDVMVEELRTHYILSLTERETMENHHVAYIHKDTWEVGYRIIDNYEAGYYTVPVDLEEMDRLRLAATMLRWKVRLERIPANEELWQEYYREVEDRFRKGIEGLQGGEEVLLQ